MSDRNQVRLRKDMLEQVEKLAAENPCRVSLGDVVDGLIREALAGRAAAARKIPDEMAITPLVRAEPIKAASELAAEQQDQDESNQNP